MESKILYLKKSDFFSILQKYKDDYERINQKNMLLEKEVVLINVVRR